MHNNVLIILVLIINIVTIICKKQNSLQSLENISLEAHKHMKYPIDLLDELERNSIEDSLNFKHHRSLQQMLYPTKWGPGRPKGNEWDEGGRGRGQHWGENGPMDTTPRTNSDAICKKSRSACDASVPSCPPRAKANCLEQCEMREKKCMEMLEKFTTTFKPKMGACQCPDWLPGNTF